MRPYTQTQPTVRNRARLRRGRHVTVLGVRQGGIGATAGVARTVDGGGGSSSREQGTETGEGGRDGQ
jgi:hypothetical protein